MFKNSLLTHTNTQEKYYRGVTGLFEGDVRARVQGVKQRCNPHG